MRSTGNKEISIDKWCWSHFSAWMYKVENKSTNFTSQFFKSNFMYYLYELAFYKDLSYN